MKMKLILGSILACVSIVEWVFSNGSTNVSYAVYPILLAVGAALSAAGAGANMAAASASKNEMERKTRQELMRQRGYAREDQNTFQQSLQQSNRATSDQQIAQGAQQAQQNYANVASVPLTPTNIPTTSDTTVSSAQTKATNDASNKARANYVAPSEWSLQQTIKNMHAQQQMGLVNSLSRFSASTLPYELQRASHAGDALSAAGTALGVAGSVAGLGSSLFASPWGAAASPAMGSSLSAADIPALSVSGANGMGAAASVAQLPWWQRVGQQQTSPQYFMDRFPTTLRSRGY